MAQKSNPRRHSQSDGDKSARFMRKKAGNRPVKMRKKSRLTSRHIILTFFILGVFFFGVERLWTFLITWEQLNIKQVEIDCRHPLLNNQVKDFISRIPMGNILLLDPSEISISLKDLPWAATVRVRKIFPSTLRVTVVERKPWAVVKKDRIYLIDRDGVVLQPAGPEAMDSLPLLSDREEFADDYLHKIQAAGKFLDLLIPGESGYRHHRFKQREQYENQHSIPSERALSRSKGTGGKIQIFSTDQGPTGALRKLRLCGSEI